MKLNRQQVTRTRGGVRLLQLTDACAPLRRSAPVQPASGPCAFGITAATTTPAGVAWCTRTFVRHPAAAPPQYRLLTDAPCGLYRCPLDALHRLSAARRQYRIRPPDHYGMEYLVAVNAQIRAL
jgi:hypothetical protein